MQEGCILVQQYLLVSLQFAFICTKQVFLFQPCSSATSADSCTGGSAFEFFMKGSRLIYCLSVQMHTLTKKTIVII